MKKIFIISSIFLVIVLFFLGVYNFAFKKNNSQIAVVQNEEKVGQNEKNSTEQANSVLSIKKMYPVSDQGVIGAAYDKKTDSILYYSAQDGTTWKSDINGKNKQQISKARILGLKDVVWSPDKMKVITTVNNTGTDIFYEYDTVNQKATQLKDGLDTAIWDNTSSKIIYKYFDSTTKERTLNIANPDGSNWQKLTDINFRNLSVVQIPLTSIISFWNTGSANEETSLNTIGITDSQAKEIFKEKFGADYLWAPNGTMALISSLSEKNGKKITLGTVDLNGNYTDLNVPTLVSKCVWSSDNKTVYYALAGAVAEGAILPDDYKNGKITTKDTFWKMDITTGKKERVIEPEESTGAFDAANIFLSSTEDALYFVNKIDKKLYKIEL